jgi:regulator of sigma E protease
VVAPGRPAAKAGIQVGDLVVAADGMPVRYWEEFVEAVESKANDTVALVLKRGESLVSVKVVPEAETAQDEVTGARHEVGRIGVGQQVQARHVRYGLGPSLAEGTQRTGEAVGQVWFALKGLVLGRLPLRDLGGPLLIGQMSGTFVRAGFEAFLSFMAFFSVNLAILNLLPVPVLDGGHLAFLVAEGIRGRPLSLSVRMRLSQVGLALLIALMALATTNDVMRWIRR